MSKRWSSDVSAGMLVLAVGALISALVLFFWPVALPVALGVMLLGIAVAAFGGFEYFVSVVHANRSENARP